MMQAYLPTLFGLLSLASAANILVMLPMPFYSHTMPYMELFKKLASKGHNVTMVTPFIQKPPIPNMNDIKVTVDMNKLMDNFIKNGGPTDFSKHDGLLAELVGFNMFFLSNAEIIAQDETIQRVFKDQSSSYDLIITETFFGQEFFTALGHKHNAPVISISASGMNPTIAQWTGNHFPTAYFPITFFPFTDRMKFLERAKNSFFYMWYNLNTYFLYHPQMDALMRKYVVYPGSESLPPLDTILRNISITLIDSHLSFTYPHPLHSNIIEVSGLSLKEKESLPNDLQKYMDEATEGVIYFSLGSHFKTYSLKPHVVSAFVEAFANVKQKILMKWDDDVLPGKTDNVKIAKWLPQASILAHPNCRIFISHGGLNGIKEGMFYKVPIITMPLFGDQKYNAELVESFGIGIKLDHKTLSESVLLGAINKILANPSYQENAKKRSDIMKDRPMSALDTAVYWVEHVIRHKGAPHLRPSVLDMPFCQYWLLDVIAFFAFILILLIAIMSLTLFIIFKCIKCVFCKKNVNNKSKKSKKA